MTSKGRVRLKLLLITADGTDPTFDAWTNALEREGVPYDVIIAAADRAPLCASALSDGANGNYQGVVLTTSNAEPALSPAEREALENFQLTFGIRRIGAYVFPSSKRGLSSPRHSGPLNDLVGSVTPEGRRVFPYLVGPVPFTSGAHGYLANPCGDCPGHMTVLVSGGAAALVGVYERPSGQEELFVTVDSNPAMIHHQLLRHGMLNWVTRGVFLGTQRHYLELHVDDIFWQSHRWDHLAKRTSDASTRPIRMQASDVARAISWMREKRLRLDLLYNGRGASPDDALTKALLENRGAFGWINHTWAHANCDVSSVEVIKDEIERNREWASANAVEIDPTELVTGEHSGLASPNIALALSETAISWIGTDNSREPATYSVGSARTVPRWPTNLCYDVATRSDQLDEYNWFYYENCAQSATTTARTRPATWSDFVASEASMIFLHLVSNDPRPHYFHQANLAEEGIFYDVIDHVLERWHQYFNCPIVQLAPAAVGRVLLQQERWDRAVASDRVTAWLAEDRVHVRASETIDVPLTGTQAGDPYGGVRSGWVTVAAGSTAVFELARPRDLASAPLPPA